MRVRVRFSAPLLAAIAAALVASPQTARADFIRLVTSLSGPNESPPNTSPGTGFAEVDLDTLNQTMRVQVTFSGLTTGTTASHIHAATASPGTGTAMVATTVPTFPNFPSGVTSGMYDQTFDMTLDSSYNPAFEAAHGGTAASAEAALFAALETDRAYLNIHTQMFPGGEVRGFLVPAVPEPASLTLLGLGALGLLGYRWRRRQQAV
jgi:hypothetical protein